MLVDQGERFGGVRRRMDLGLGVAGLKEHGKRRGNKRVVVDYEIFHFLVSGRRASDSINDGKCSAGKGA